MSLHVFPIPEWSGPGDRCIVCKGENLTDYSVCHGCSDRFAEDSNRELKRLWKPVAPEWWGPIDRLGDRRSDDERYVGVWPIQPDDE